jgi:hypothetical protein
MDASLAIHPYMRGHSGEELSLGMGFPIIISTKHKLNTQSSTETELAGAYDFMPAICWTRYETFLGYLEKNDKASSSKLTKHIRIRYYFCHLVSEEK